jgi:sec-independent protein translocase protein TatB
MSFDPTKIIFVLVVGLILLGPERLPQVARKAGELWSLLKGPTEFLNRQIRQLEKLPGASELIGLTGVGRLGSIAQFPGLNSPGAANVQSVPSENQVKQISPGHAAGFVPGSPDLN